MAWWFADRSAAGKSVGVALKNSRGPGFHDIVNLWRLVERRRPPRAVDIISMPRGKKLPISFGRELFALCKGILSLGG